MAEIGCAPTSLDQPMDRDRAEELARHLKALADPARLQLISMLRSAASHEACVCDLTGPLGLSQPTVSHHLRILSDAGFVTRERRGTWSYYSVNPDALEQLAFLTPSLVTREGSAG